MALYRVRCFEITMSKDTLILQKIEKEAQAGSRSLPIVGPKKGQFLESLIKTHAPGRVLEIGTLVGYSAILIARNLPKGKITCLEMSPENAEEAQKNLSEAGFNTQVEILIGDARKFINHLKETFDFVFIDAEKKQYLTYLQLLEKNDKIKKGSVILADNAKIFAEEMKDYLDYVRTSPLYQSSYHDFDEDGMEVSIKVQ